MRAVVVLHARQAIGSGLGTAFPPDRFSVRVWTTGDPAAVFRDGARPEGVTVEQVPNVADGGLAARALRLGAGIEIVTNDEYCLSTCAGLRARLGLPARLPEDLVGWTDKLVMKTRLRAAGVVTPDFRDLGPVPPAAAAADLVRALGLPLVVKPRQEANNRGIRRLRSASELADWLDAHAGEPGWEAESFVEGTLCHANAIVTDGRLTPVQVGRYTAPLLALSEGRPAGGVTLPEGHRLAIAGRRLNDEVVAALGGRGAFVVHTEFFVTAGGQAVFLETAARAPGALVSDMAEVHAGIHLERTSYLLQVGGPVPAPAPTARYAGWLWFPDPGVLEEHRAGRLRLRSQHRLTAQPGQPIPAALMAWSDDFDVLVEDLAEVDRAARAGWSTAG